MLKSFFAGIAAIYLAITGIFHASPQLASPSPTTVEVASSTQISVGTASSTNAKIEALQRQLDKERAEREGLQKQIQTSNTKSQSPAPKINQSQVIVSPEENFSSVTESAIVDFINQYREGEKLISDYRQIPEARASALSERIATNENLLSRAPDEDSRKLTEDIIAIYKDDLEKTNATINYYTKYIDYFEQRYVQPWQGSLNQLKAGATVSRERFIEVIQALKNYLDEDPMSDIRSVSSNYNSYVDKQDAYYQSFFNRLTAILGSYQSYTPPPNQHVYIAAPPPIPHSISCYSLSAGTGLSTTNCNVY